MGRRRRPSGEPPPLPRTIRPSTKWYAAAAAGVLVLWSALLLRPLVVVVTAADDGVMRVVAHGRVGFVTSMMLALQSLGSPWTVRLVAWGTIVVLLAFRRFQHLAAYLAVLLVGSLLLTGMLATAGRMRPAGVAILGRWQGYAFPSRPVAELALVLAAATATLVPAGAWRRRATVGLAALVGVLGVAQVYLGVDHPSDVAAAVALGWALTTVLLRLAVPDEVVPVAYRRGRTAHLDVGGRRGEAIVQALDQQLGLDVGSVEPFGLEGSAGSTPLLLRTADGALFAKLYARSHLRADRWYKLTRMVLYGRLEDEKPFSSVRRLVEYEDHLLRLLRDAGLPTPRPYGFVEITPEREYAIVMELFPGARELGTEPVDDAVIGEALDAVRLLWDAGVAHRDIKPSNVLVQDGHVRLIDVAFAAVRPTPWRQAVDLANMMLTLALAADPERVYAEAVRRFAPDDIAEAFAATRGVTVPSQLRSRLRADGRDLVARFRRLAPERTPVPIQVWSVRRVAVTLGVVALAAVAASAVAAYIDVAGLL
ncbi:MAG TPA: RIO1 family regulatory kinase/ATPase [Acidimicrobiales bacterium]|nr:RIO1 family regulatory kinase/ATPase [Acidimicrobiales bacterium]